MKRKKVGIMGGTFNPIHNSHLALGQVALEQFHLDSVLFIPSGTPYLKDSAQVLPGKIRGEMTELAILDNPDFSISYIEVEREGNTYSFETIHDLKAQNPDTDYYFIVGADSFFYMENWVNPEGIFGEVPLLVAVRGNVSREALQNKIDEMKEKYHCEIFAMDFCASDVSSTYLRELVRKKQSIRYYVPKKVEQYILEHHLYGS